ncbi:hypothetical protein ABPG74_019724 [Tetrahymena malaccensis]
MYQQFYSTLNYLKIPKTNLLLVNTGQLFSNTVTNTVSNIVYYLDLSIFQQNVINIVKPDYTIIKMEYIEQINKVLVLNFQKLILADPYSLQAIQHLELQSLLEFEMIKGTNYAVVSQSVCQSFIIDSINLKVVKSMDGCSKGLSPLNSILFPKSFRLQNGLVQIFIMNNVNIQLWTFDLTAIQVQFTGYLPNPPTCQFYCFSHFDKHTFYDVFFFIGNQYNPTSMYVYYFDSGQYKLLNSTDLKQFTYQSNQLLNIQYINFNGQDSLFMSDIQQIYRVDIQVVMDSTYQHVLQVNFISLDNKQIFVKTHNHGLQFKSWYYAEENQALIIPLNTGPVSAQYSNYIYSYQTDNYVENQYYYSYGQNKIYQAYYKGFKYYVVLSSYSLDIVYSLNPPYFVVEQHINQSFSRINSNSLMEVKNCPLCYLAIEQSNYLQFFKILETPTTYNISLTSIFPNFQFDQVNLNLDSYYDGVSNFWVVIGTSFQQQTLNYLFLLIDMKTGSLNNLQSDDPKDNLKLTCYAQYSDLSKQIVGIDVSGTVYVWNSTNITQFLFKKQISKLIFFNLNQLIYFTLKGQYSCLNSPYGQLYNDDAAVYLIAVTLSNFQMKNCIFSNQFSILRQVNDVKVIINQASIIDSTCGQGSDPILESLFQASEYQVKDMQIEGNQFCNHKIFSTISSLNQQNLFFSFENVYLANNFFNISDSYLFFNAIYYFNLQPMHTLILKNITAIKNKYFPNIDGQQQSENSLSNTQLIQVNKLKNITISNITLQNHFEIAFSSISQSYSVNIFNVSCINDQNFAQNIQNNEYSGCLWFSDIQKFNLNIMNATNINASDNSILSILNQNYFESSINLNQIEVSNSIFTQTKVNSYVNPVFISSTSYSKITVNQSYFHDNVLFGLLNSQTFSTTAVQVINPIGDLILLNTQFKRSKSNSVYNFLHIQSNNIQINNCTFTQSSYDLSDQKTLFQQYGGCARIKSNYLQLNGSQFSQSVSSIGSFLFIEPLSTQLNIFVNQTSFSEGFSMIDGSAIFIDSNNINLNLSILNSNFTDVYLLSDQSYAVSLQSYAQNQPGQLNYIYLKNIIITNLLGGAYSAFINPTYTNFTTEGLNLIQVNQKQIPNQFRTFIKLQQIALINVQNCITTINECYFSNLYSIAQSISPLLISSFQSNVTIKNSNITQSNFTQSMIDLQEGKLVIQNTQFINLSQIKAPTRLLQYASQNSNQMTQQNSLVRLTNSSLQINSNSIFNQIICQQNCQGSAIFLSYSSFSIQDSQILSSNANYGGAISIYGLNSDNNLIQNTYFYNNKATNDGGAVYLQANQNDVFKLLISQSQFIQNNAQLGYGGAIYIQSQGTNSQKQQVEFIQSQIKQNQANIGGGIYNLGINPAIDSISVLTGNTAIQYGDDQFSYPTQLYLINQDNFNSSYDLTKNIIVFDSFKSGGTLPNIIFQLRDQNSKPIYQQGQEQISSYIQVSSKTLQADHYQAKGNTTVNLGLQDKAFNFSQLQLIGIPGSQSYFEFKSDSIKIFNEVTKTYSQDYSFMIQVNFRKCQYGEIISKFNILQECQSCEGGKYTLDFNGCYPCPEGGTCQDGLISLSSGYWREDEYSDKILLCYNRQENCINSSYGNNVCVKGNIGPLCEECDILGDFWGQSYTRSDKYQCVLCKSQSQNIWKLVLSILWLLVSVYLTVSSDKDNQQQRVIINLFYGNTTYNLKNSKNKFLFRQRAKVYIKIFTNYVQIVSAAVTFNLNIQQQIIQVVTYFGNPIKSSMDYFDCLLREYNTNIPVIYLKLIISVVSPIGVIILYSCFIIIIILNILFLIQILYRIIQGKKELLQNKLQKIESKFPVFQNCLKKFQKKKTSEINPKLRQKLSGMLKKLTTVDRSQRDKLFFTLKLMKDYQSLRTSQDDKQQMLFSPQQSINAIEQMNKEFRLSDNATFVNLKQNIASMTCSPNLRIESQQIQMPQQFTLSPQQIICEIPTEIENKELKLNSITDEKQLVQIQSDADENKEENNEIFKSGIIDFKDYIQTLEQANFPKNSIVNNQNTCNKKESLVRTSQEKNFVSIHNTEEPLQNKVTENSQSN